MQNPCASAGGIIVSEASEVKQQMANPSNYPIYRERLMGKHLVNGDVRGYLKIPLPRFDKFVEMWG